MEDLKLPNRPSHCKWQLNSSEESPHSFRASLLVNTTINLALPDLSFAVGNTPLISLNKIAKAENLKCELLAKCEFMNPGGSIKDRIALRIIQDAEESGILKPGMTIIEATSGNTGIGLALMAVVKGYKCVVVMPMKNSAEKVKVLHALGAKIIRTPTEASFDSPDGCFLVAQRLSKEISNSIILDQYQNPGNPLAHYDQTGPEIWHQCNQHLDMVVAGGGTCGTLTGIGRFLKEQDENIKVVGVEPYQSIFSESKDGQNTTMHSSYQVEGIGQDFIPTVLDQKVIDSWVKVDDKESFLMARRLIQEEGILCGGSSGAAVVAALKVCSRLNQGQRCVVILPDGIRNYMSKFIDDEWMKANNFSKELNENLNELSLSEEPL